MLCRGTTMAAVLISGTISFHLSDCTAHSCLVWPTPAASLLFCTRWAVDFMWRVSGGGLATWGSGYFSGLPVCTCRIHFLSVTNANNAG